MGAFKIRHARSLLGSKRSRGPILLLIAGLLCLALALAPSAHAQTQPRTTSPSPAARPVPDAAYDPAERAFMGLAEPDRRAIQEGLIWSGDYKGLVDGGFGRGTRAAIIAWATRQSLPADGTLDGAARQKLATATMQARQAVAFMAVTDMRTGVSIGVPQKLVPMKTQTATGTRWASTDGAITLETRQSSENDEALAILFAQLSNESASRKISYKALRPNFMVVSGQQGDSVFYTYLGIGPAAPSRPVRGYTFSWPKGRPDLEPVSLAVASAFQPFPNASNAPAGASATPVPVPSGVSEAKSPPAAGLRPTLAGTAVALTSTLAVASLTTTACGEPSIGTTRLKPLRTDPSSGLVLLEAPGGHSLAGALAQTASPASGDKLMVLFASASTAGEISVTEGSWLAPIKSGDRARMIASLQAPSGGALVLDRAGQVVGIVAARANESAGHPQGLVNIISAQEIAAFAGPQPPTLSTSAGTQPGAPDTAQIVGRVKPSLAGLFCH